MNVCVELRGTFAAGRIGYPDSYRPAPADDEVYDPAELHQLVDEFNKVGSYTKKTDVSSTAKRTI
jgi:hypothetical protein